MKGRLWLVAIVIAIGVCGILIPVYRRSAKELSAARAGLVHHTNLAANLMKHAHDAESERDSANRTIRKLRGEVAALQQQRKGDSLVIEVLWRELQPGIRGTDKPVWHDWETIKNMLTSSEDNQEEPLAHILTAEGIQATLEDHKGNPTYWVAAASLVQDEDAAFKYLEEAAKLYPKSAVVLSSLVEALMTRGQFDETTVAHIAQLKEVDPANCLPDYYDAYCRFQSGDLEGALKCLAEGSVKGRLADNGMDLLMARYNYLLNAGCSDGAATLLSGLI